MANMTRDLQTFLVLNRYSSGLAESVGALVKGLFHVIKKGRPLLGVGCLRGSPSYPHANLA